jgi:hypothetical protein
MVEAWESGQNIGQGKWSNGHGAGGSGDGDGGKRSVGSNSSSSTVDHANANREGGGVAQRRGAMVPAEIAQLVAAGPPDRCTTPGVYPHCGLACEAAPSAGEVASRRLFKDFSVLTGKEGYERSYEEAGALFKSMGKSDGFDAMFSFRFS